MKFKEINILEYISGYEEYGGVVVLLGRPAIGKTKTCCEIYQKKYKNLGCMYFDLENNFLDFFGVSKCENFYLFSSSLEIIKEIERKADNNLKYVFIDGYNYLNDKSDWFKGVYCRI